jgi:hypothetical protein
MEKRIRKMVFEVWFEKIVYFTKIYALYTKKKQIAGHKNDHVMRKSPGNFALVRAFGLYCCKENQTNEETNPKRNEKNNVSMFRSIIYVFLRILIHIIYRKNK